ncbi:MAG TPA: hypothetical protein VNR60_06510 [Croceibacterium sp.]|nr:hypothetical protein [Croceibacterium sp.]
MFWKGTLPKIYGEAPVAASRYFALYAAQLGWLALGFYLLSHAVWPSTCEPGNLLEIYSCSGRLADQRGWLESALMTWLWTTPILIALEISRRFSKQQRRPILGRD